MMKYLYMFLLSFLFLNANSSEISFLDGRSSLDSLLNIKKVELDSLRHYFEHRSNNLKCEILKETDITSIPCLKGYNYKDPSALFSKALKEGELTGFELIMRREILYHEDFDFMPYALYMAEIHNSSAGFFYIWLAYYEKNKRKKTISRERRIYLENLEDDEKYLALASLIKSAQLKYTLAISYLADYYREGIYVRKDVDYADQLEKNRNKK